jgi:hypothetical protein
MACFGQHFCPSSGALDYIMQLVVLSTPWVAGRWSGSGGSSETCRANLNLLINCYFLSSWLLSLLSIIMMHGQQNIKNSLWFYGCTFIAVWSPTCFGHTYGDLQGGESKNTDIIKICQNLFTGTEVPWPSLCTLHHPSQICIMFHYMYLLRTSFHWTLPQKTIFNF